MFSRLKFRTMMFGIPLVGILSIAALSIYQERVNAIEARKEVIRSVVDIAYNIAAKYQALEVRGMSREAAQKSAVAAISAAAYGGENRRSNYIYIWTTEGVVVTHVRQEIIGHNMLDDLKDGRGGLIIRALLAAGLQGGGEAFLSTWFPHPGQHEAVEKLQYVRIFDKWNWEIGSGVYADDIDALFSDSLWIILIETMIVLGLVGIAVSQLNRRLLRQLGDEPDDALVLMRKVADGDLTVSLERARRGSMLSALDATLGALRKFLVEIGVASKRLRGQAREIAAASWETAEAIRMQADAASVMAEAARMTAGIEHISESADKIERDSAQTARLAETGEQQAAQANAGIGPLVHTLSTAFEQIRGLDRRADRISALAAEIKDIATQALDAANEAERAGAQDGGFVVTADVVREIAERTATAIAEIEQTIDAIQGDTRAAATAMATALPQADEGAKLAGSTAATLRAIHAGAQATLGGIRGVAEAAQEQSAASMRIAQRVGQIAHGVENAHDLLRKTATSARTLERISDEIELHVERFKC